MMRNRIPLTKLQKGMKALTWLLAVATFVITAIRWRTLPKVMAIHYDAYGVANDWGGRWVVWMVPVLLALCCGIISACERLPLKAINLPFRPNPEREFFVLRAVRDMMCVVNLEVALMFTVMQAEILEGKNLSMWFIWGISGVILATLIFGIWRTWKCNQGTL